MNLGELYSVKQPCEPSDLRLEKISANRLVRTFKKRQ